MDRSTMLPPPWVRCEHLGTPIYLHPDRPDWLVPGQRLDRLLHQPVEATADPASLLARQRLAAQLAGPPPPPYPGRGELLELQELQECWFHLTNRCNLACNHCLFSSSSDRRQTLPAAVLQRGLAEARALGCRLFSFTGGEPLLYPGFLELVQEILAKPAAHVAVLSNGLLLHRHLDQLQRLDRQRFHLQISLDGLEENHDRLRGAGTFVQLLDNLSLLRQRGLTITLSTAVNRDNLQDLPAIVSLAADLGVGNLHLLWHFVRGKGRREQFATPAEILPHLIEAQQTAEGRGVIIDNVETLKSQVFSSPGTRHDLSNAGWESLAVGADGHVYPSPALVGIPALDCGSLEQGLDRVWRTSPVLQAVRRASLVASPASARNPLRFLVGGGDLDHSYLAGGSFTGHDPYLELYNQLALWLISRQAGQYPQRADGEILLRMGEVRHDCPDGGSPVSLTHSNCMISLAADGGRASIREFYAQAAQAPREDIVNPFTRNQAADFIPLASRQRSYGCGSPVTEAAPQPGEVVVDLGCGSGVECCLAAAAVGPEGKVYGIDMTAEMLALAGKAAAQAAERLGYANIEIREGFLEEIPLADASADLVISNCVINLSQDKRKIFHEIHRILKPGGRLVISDITTDTLVPVTIKNNQQFRGQCLGGAVRQPELLAMLQAAGFTAARLLKRFPYRQVDETRFHSLTFQALKPATSPQPAAVVYRGPFAAVVTDAGDLLLRGVTQTVPLAGPGSLDDSLFLLDRGGTVTNLTMTNSCCAASGKASGSDGGPGRARPAATATSDGDGRQAAATAPPAKVVTLPLARTAATSAAPSDRRRAGCMVCGSDIIYLHNRQKANCHYCGGAHQTSTLCSQGHFICDHCHQQDGLSAIRLLCLETTEQDLLALFQTIRSHPSLPMHGPEHHAMVPGIILACYRNQGGAISKEQILTGIERGSKVPGGVCGFWGGCGAALGVGIAFSVLFAATPLTPLPRQKAQQATARVLARIAGIQGGRCCQRESVTALQEAAAISREWLPVFLRAKATVTCQQWAANQACVRQGCPLWPKATSRRRQPGPGA